MKALSLAASLLAACIGALALVGWALDIEVLKSVVPGLVAMKANTAIGLVLSGAGMALVSWKEPGRWLRAGITALAALVFSLGALTLAEYFFGWDLRIDQWLFREAPNTVWTSQPGRMAPISAFCFVLIGVALLVASRPILERLRPPILGGFGAALAAMGSLALAGCVAEGWFHAPWWNDSGLALHTAGAFLLLGSALLVQAIGREGLRWSLDALVTAGFAAAIAVMMLAAAVSYNFTNQLLQTLTWVSHRQEVLKEIGNAAGAIASVENEQRGFIILGDPHLLDWRRQTIVSVHAALHNIRSLTADNPIQQRWIGDLVRLVGERQDVEDKAIAVREAQGFAAAQQIMATDRSNALTNGINHLLKAMRDEEYNLLDHDRAAARTASMSTFLVLPLGVFLSLTISSLGLFFLNAGVGERVRVERAWRQSEERFRTVVEKMSEGLVISSLDGKLIHWNPAALAMHGFANDEDLKRHLADFPRVFELAALDGAVLPLDQWPMSRIIRGEPIQQMSVRIRRLDTDWQRVFDYAGNIVQEPGGERRAFVTISDITERTQSEEALRASEVQLRSFVEQAPVAIAMLDRQMCYLAASRRWVLGFGRDESDLIGKCHYDIHPDTPEEWKKIHREALAGIPQRNDEDRWAKQDGSMQWLRWAVQPWYDARGEIGGIMILTEDISDRKLGEQIRVDNARLEAENRRFAEASRLKSEFLANMSHELRTPLNGIIGFTELLSDERPGPVNRKQQEYLGSVLSSARHLLQLINDVLDLAKVEAGKLSFEPEVFELGRGIEEVCAVLKGMATQKGVHLTSKTAPGLGAVRLDEHRFKQICFNLLSNAVKFTDAGGKVEIVATEHDAETFEVRVTDTGIGIREEDLDRLFREFEQLDSGASRRYEGTGLGLALTRKLVEMQGGSIAVCSEYGRGSTFSVVLPKGTAGGNGEATPS
jgi:PAS domain S-box-containing protein